MKKLIIFFYLVATGYSLWAMEACEEVMEIISPPDACYKIIRRASFERGKTSMCFIDSNESSIGLQEDDILLGFLCFNDAVNFKEVKVYEKLFGKELAYDRIHFPHKCALNIQALLVFNGNDLFRSKVEIKAILIGDPEETEETTGVEGKQEV